MQAALAELVQISQAVGKRPDFVQGGGGNTSVKLDDRWMAIKASGFELGEVSLERAYTVVDYHRILTAYRETSWADPLPQLYAESVAPWPELPAGRPSIETGFHSLLQRVVIHTHSVYANLFTCSVLGRARLESLWPEVQPRLLWVGFAKPGFELTKLVDQGLSQHRDNYGIEPTFILLENHGLVVSAPDAASGIQAHNEFNSRLIELLGLGSYPAISLHADPERSLSVSPFVAAYLAEISGPEAISPILFPDQIVYFRNDFYWGDEASDKKIQISERTRRIRYLANPKESKAIEETIMSYLYLLSTMASLGFQPQFLPEKFISEITNMEEEKYRKRLIASQGRSA